MARAPFVDGPPASLVDDEKFDANDFLRRHDPGLGWIKTHESTLVDLTFKFRKRLASQQRGHRADSKYPNNHNLIVKHAPPRTVVQVHRRKGSAYERKQRLHVEATVLRLFDDARRFKNALPTLKRLLRLGGVSVPRMLAHVVADRTIVLEDAPFPSRLGEFVHDLQASDHMGTASSIARLLRWNRSMMLCMELAGYQLGAFLGTLHSATMLQEMSNFLVAGVKVLENDASQMRTVETLMLHLRRHVALFPGAIDGEYAANVCQLLEQDLFRSTEQYEESFILGNCDLVSFFTWFNVVVC